MNTILVSGTVKSYSNGKFSYAVNIYAAKEGSSIEYICSFKNLLGDYKKLWRMVKNKIANYYSDPKFEDGAYTQFLDHLILIE